MRQRPPAWWVATHGHAETLRARTSSETAVNATREFAGQVIGAVDALPQSVDLSVAAETPAMSRRFHHRRIRPGIRNLGWRQPVVLPMSAMSGAAAAP